jgi:ribosomal protein L37AE/L43A
MAAVKRNEPKRAASSDSTYSLMEFMREFPSDAVCLEWLWRRGYSADGEHAQCPKCGVERKFHRVASRPSWSCDHCGHHLHPTANTIFHKSSTALHLWFYAIFLMSQTRCGVSAKQLERELGVTYKTAWRMANLIRNKLMEQDDEPLSGEVEMDETYYGGEPRVGDKMTRKERYERKVPVWGAVERGGRVRAAVVRHSSAPILMGQARKYVLPSSTVFTDEAGQYNALSREGYRHRRIKHSAQVYVKGTVTTNTIEGFWGLVKNGIAGTYHAVSEKWLQGYVNEYAWRYNHREDTFPMFFSLLQTAARPAS